MAILPPAQIRLWPHLQHAADLGLVLYGDTAIALRLGHRQSVDFDFFSDRPLDRDAMHQALPFLAQSLVLEDRPNSLCVLVPTSDDDQGSVKVSFFGGIDFGRVGEPDITADGAMQIASLDDLMATKAKRSCCSVSKPRTTAMWLPWWPRASAWTKGWHQRVSYSATAFSQVNASKRWCTLRAAISTR